jgi:transposase-like protein
MSSYLSEYENILEYISNEHGMKYSKEIAQDVCTMSIKDAAEKYKVSPHTISAWRKKHRLDKAETHPPLKTTCSNCEAMREQIEHLRNTPNTNAMIEMSRISSHLEDAQNELRILKRLVKHYMQKDEE